ncbi:UNKNOWN [Stylonychia lemnae]|uniref:Uncharacterized protein n=1 Tax=Stylonychia lemnae TaxID=5949 RepID=A0A078BES3_STYLE|nr:UNKNOWN [Stylonychia lemnae]|eukprot:CDW91662.1 UNKNOWN [Stylonychia lemnae]
MKNSSQQSPTTNTSLNNQLMAQLNPGSLTNLAKTRIIDPTMADKILSQSQILRTRRTNNQQDDNLSQSSNLSKISNSKFLQDHMEIEDMRKSPTENQDSKLNNESLKESQILSFSQKSNIKLSQFHKAQTLNSSNQNNQHQEQQSMHSFQKKVNFSAKNHQSEVNDKQNLNGNNLYVSNPNYEMQQDFFHQKTSSPNDKDYDRYKLLMPLQPQIAISPFNNIQPGQTFSNNNQSQNSSLMYQTNRKQTHFNDEIDYNINCTPDFKNIQEELFQQFWDQNFQQFQQSDTSQLNISKDQASQIFKVISQNLDKFNEIIKQTNHKSQASKSTQQSSQLNSSQITNQIKVESLDNHKRQINNQSQSATQTGMPNYKEACTQTIHSIFDKSSNTQQSRLGIAQSGNTQKNDQSQISILQDESKLVKALDNFHINSQNSTTQNNISEIRRTKRRRDEFEKQLEQSSANKQQQSANQSNRNFNDYIQMHQSTGKKRKLNQTNQSRNNTSYDIQNNQNA